MSKEESKTVDSAMDTVEDDSTEIPPDPQPSGSQSQPVSRVQQPQAYDLSRSSSGYSTGGTLCSGDELRVSMDTAGSSQGSSLPKTSPLKRTAGRVKEEEEEEDDDDEEVAVTYRPVRKNSRVDSPIDMGQNQAEIQQPEEEAKERDQRNPRSAADMLSYDGGDQIRVTSGAMRVEVSYMPPNTTFNYPPSPERMETDSDDSDDESASRKKKNGGVGPSGSK